MEKAFAGRLFESYYMEVYSYLVTLCGEPVLAEELTQKTFFRALTTSSPFRGEAGEFTWLCAIAKHLFADELRKKRRRGELPEELPDDSAPEEAIADREIALRLHMELHRLQEPYREVFSLRVFGELSFREIGTIFGKSESWARVTCHRAKLMLRERMEQYDTKL